MLQLLVLLLGVSLSESLLGVIGGEQSVAVTGNLLCDGRPAGGVKLKLYDVNTFTLDNFLDEQYSNVSGGFFLRGHEKSITTIDPKLNIYHKCNYNGLCYKKLAIRIPQSYVGSDYYNSYPFNVGTIELAGRYSGQSTDCINK